MSTEAVPETTYRDRLYCIAGQHEYERRSPLHSQCAHCGRARSPVPPLWFQMLFLLVVIPAAVFVLRLRRLCAWLRGDVE